MTIVQYIYVDAIHGVMNAIDIPGKLINIVSALAIQFAWYSYQGIHNFNHMHAIALHIPMYTVSKQFNG